jgi:ABC-2 type transport system permease protein
MTVFLYTLKRSFRNLLNLLFIIVLPLGLVFLPRAPEMGWDAPIGFQFYSGLVFFIAFLLIRGVAEDRGSGILTRIAAAPITHFRYLSQTLLAYACLMVAQNAAMVFGGALYHGGVLGNPLRLFLAHGTFSLAALAFCLAVCSLIRLREVAYGACAALIIFLSAIGGAMWPTSTMPDLLRRAAMVSPVYWLNIAVTSTPGEGDQFALSLAVMLLFTLVFLFAGSKRRMVF